MKSLNKLVSLSVALVLFAQLASCTGNPTPNVNIVAGSTDCEVSAGGNMPISLVGEYSTTAEIKWSATYGTITPDTGVNVNYTAPSNQLEDVILVVINQGDNSYSYSKTCKISPLVTDADIPTSIPTLIMDAPTLEPSPSPILSATPTTEAYTIAITEVMLAPCGELEYEPYNEYIELYNYGTNPVDVGGWWILDIGSKDNLDQLVPWSARNPNLFMGEGVVIDTTIIPPGGYAVILSANYPKKTGPNGTPYVFPSQTILLTEKNGNRVGDEIYGLTVTDSPLDILVLFVGTKIQIEHIVSSYGNPKLPINLTNGLQDNSSDDLPLIVKQDCSSVQRVNPEGPDIFANWIQTQEITPGSGTDG